MSKMIIKCTVKNGANSVIICSLCQMIAKMYDSILVPEDSVWVSKYWDETTYCCTLVKNAHMQDGAYPTFLCQERII